MVETKTNLNNETENPSPAEKREELSIEELTDLLKRTQANFVNYRNQTQAYIEEVKKMAGRDILLQVLPILDNFELALKAVPNDQASTEFVRGIILIHSQILQLLQQNNVAPIETMGKDFDPYYHEALMKVPSELPANKIIEEFQKGFTLQGKVLRHAKVKVSSGQKNSGNKFYQKADQTVDSAPENDENKNKHENEKIIGGK